MEVAAATSGSEAIDAVPATDGLRLDGYSELREMQLSLDHAGDGNFLICFWLYLTDSAPSSCPIIHQMKNEVHDEVPFLALSGEYRLLLFPLLTLHTEAPVPGSSSLSSASISSVDECPRQKWVHIGCEVAKSCMRLHINGELIAETQLCPTNSMQNDQDSFGNISLVGSDGKLSGYVYGIRLMSALTPTEIQQHMNASPINLSLDTSSMPYGIELETDGSWSILGGKGSCQNNLSLNIVLSDAFGHPVDRVMEVVASVLYAENRGENGTALSSEDNVQASRRLLLQQGHGVLELNSQILSKMENRLSRICFRALCTSRYPFLEACTPPICYISPDCNADPPGSVKRSNGGYHAIDCISESTCKHNGNRHVPSKRQSAHQSCRPIKHRRTSHDNIQRAMGADRIQNEKMNGQHDEMALLVKSQNGEETESEPSDFESSDATSSGDDSQKDPFSNSNIFRYCLEGTDERSAFLKEATASAPDVNIIKFAEKVSLYSGCSHHRYQIIMSKPLIQEGAETWTTIARSSERALWTFAVPVIIRKFFSISKSYSRCLSGQDLEVLRRIAECGDELGVYEFERLWTWLYPVALSLSNDKIRRLWESTSPKWIEGLITREEAEDAVKSLQKPGTFVLRFPTSRSWPHPDAGCLVVTFVGLDSEVHHKLLSLDHREGDLRNLLLKEPELSQLARVVRRQTSPKRMSS